MGLGDGLHDFPGVSGVIAASGFFRGSDVVSCQGRFTNEEVSSFLKLVRCFTVCSGVWETMLMYLDFSKSLSKSSILTI